MKKYNKKYTLVEYFTQLIHTWSVESSHGAVHIHITEPNHSIAEPSPNQTYGGVEIHSRTPTSLRPPDHHHCPFTGGLCWHDGSSLAATSYVEYFKDLDSIILADHEYFWSECISHYERAFEVQ